ncbi:HNH endonuclease [Fusobacterium sp.]|uniref:HNH endonuclease n=1 Tax=Fusobacterium sp. TaxID=68766 RepID=UPI0026196B85|nr:HNH endonuclease [Fusobacterium sp.]
MILIKKNRIPSSLVKYKQTINASFDNLPKEVKDKLRTSLLKEQGYICAYCMKKLEDDSSKVKIEHYIARNEENELDYNNLLAVCKGNEGEPFERQTCDTRKGNREVKINPQVNSDILTIGYTSNGEIKSSNLDYQEDFDNILNLNDSFGLVKARREALNSLKRKLSKSKTHLKRDIIKRIYTRYSEAEIKESYVGILLWYLQKRMR